MLKIPAAFLYLMVSMLLSMMLLTPAHADKNQEEWLQFSGTVIYVELEGGFYGIQSDEGKNYLPLQLDEAFQQEELHVKVKAKKVSGQMGFRMWGTLINIESIMPTDCTTDEKEYDEK